jgi:hypothetical protein
MAIPKQMIERAACVIAGNVSKAQWDANPDLHGENLEYAEKALEAAGIGELIEALKLLIEELDDTSRRHPVFYKDGFSRNWEPSNEYAVSFSNPTKGKLRASLAEYVAKYGSKP